MELTGYLAVARRWWWTLLVATWVAGFRARSSPRQIPPTYEAEPSCSSVPYNTDRDTLAASAALVQTYSPARHDRRRSSPRPSPKRARRSRRTSSSRRLASPRTTRPASSTSVSRTPTRRWRPTLANKLAAEISLLASRGTNRPEGQLQIVDFARPPTDPVAPQKSLIVALAALAALIGAMVLVLLVEYLSAAVRSEEEFVRVTDLPFLGRVDIARSLPSSSRGLIDKAPESAAAAAYRLVLAKVAFREGHGEPVRSSSWSWHRRQPCHRPGRREPGGHHGPWRPPGHPDRRRHGRRAGQPDLRADGPLRA